VCEVLLKYGARPGTEAFSGDTPKDIAEYNNFHRVLRLIEDFEIGNRTVIKSKSHQSLSLGASPSRTTNSLRKSFTRKSKSLRIKRNKDRDKDKSDTLLLPGQG